MAQEPNTRYIVRGIIAEAPGVSTLQLSLSNGSVPKYIPGQFITVYAPELGTPEGKAYSISSAPHEKTRNITLALICGGIGIAPFRSMLQDSAQETPRRSMALFCSNRTAQDIIFKKMLDELQAADKNLRVHHFITREHVEKPMTNGRISAKAILESLDNTQPAEFLLCGSISFVRDLWRELRAAGVPEESIYTEAFFSH